MSSETDPVPGISIVIASYDSAPWLPSTIGSIVTALERSTLSAEIVVVDDGSTDDTPAVLAEIAATAPVPVRVVTQENQGRFRARWEGAQAARSRRLFLFDSRLLLDADAFRHLEELDPQLPADQAWNGHVPTDPAAPLVGRFWEVPTHLFWGGYLAHPAVTEITPENFDRVPKGTGCLVIDKDLFVEACLAIWPEDNAALVSDDTKLLRYVVERRTLRLDPGFRALYRPRVTVPGFLHHAYDRGTLFVDSYAGTGAVRNVALVGLVVAPPVAVVVFVLALVFGVSWLAWLIPALVVLGLVAPAVAASFRAAPGRAVLSYLVYVLPFGFSFWRGLVRGLRVHRGAFRRR